jgi:hypothetical protein
VRWHLDVGENESVRFRHRTVYHLLGIAGLDEDPLNLLERVGLELLDSDYCQWLNKFSLDGLELASVVTCNDEVFRELDLRTAIANRLLNGMTGTAGTTDLQADIAAQHADRQRRFGITPWLVVEVTGDDPRASIEEAEFVDDLGASVELGTGLSVLNELSRGRATDLHFLVAGALSVAAGRPIHTSPASAGCWHVRPDGEPHFRFAAHGSAKAFASRSLTSGFGDRFSHAFATAQRDMRSSRALTAAGISLQWELPESLQFLSAFTALEMLTKSTANVPEPRRGGKRTGLAKHFQSLAGANENDCQVFDRLYALRNGMAHEARFGVSVADQARELFNKYFL